jgi:phosphatidylglycerol:prolipoprotein diacylglycerol transferase
MSMLAAIPYRTFPDFALGPLTIRTFGLMVALGIVLGAVIGSRYVANRGIDPEQYTGLATRAVIAGLIGARLTWVLSHLDAIEGPIDVIAVWDGGMQFSGGLLFGALAGWWSARGRYSRTQRWHILDGSAVALTAGLAIGRIGCVAVGEHFGGPTDFFLGMTYMGGGTIEPVAVGETIHNTAFYELLHLGLLSAIYAVLLRVASDRRRPWPLGMLGAIFLVWYGTFRFITDIVRVNDTTLAGLTGAQWAGIGMVVLGLWLFATMGGRRVSEEGRAVIPVTNEPASAVKVLAATPQADGAAESPLGGTDPAPGDERSTPAAHDADASGHEPDVPGHDADGQDPAPTDAKAEPDEGDHVAPEDRSRSHPTGDDTTGTEPNWADRADVRDGSAGFVSGVRVVDAEGRPQEAEPDTGGDAEHAEDPASSDPDTERT